MANVYLVQKKYEAAALLYQQALAIYSKVLNKKHPYAAASMLGLANIYLKQNRHEDAISFYQQALTIYQEKLDPDHPRTRWLHVSIEKLLAGEGEEA